jgi:hypothetical protein
MRLALPSQYRRWLLGEKLFFPAPAHSDFFRLPPTAIPSPTKKEVLSAYHRDPNVLGGFELAAAMTAAVDPDTAGSVPHPSFGHSSFVSHFILKRGHSPMFTGVEFPGLLRVSGPSTRAMT